MLAYGLRWDSQHLAGPVVKVLTFSIDPSLRLSERESGPSVTLNMLPLFWTTRPSETSPPAGRGETCPHSVLMRNLLQARLACATSTIRRTNQNSYASYSISTTQNGNGTWVAAFGRRQEDAIRTGRGSDPISETRPQLAEVIALADAQIAIDDRLASKTR